MEANNKNLQTLEKIVELKGDCLDSKLCNQCPFKSKCLPQFLNFKNRPTKEERFNLALDNIVNTTIMEEDELSYAREK
jgi:hypothetical protein